MALGGYIGKIARVDLWTGKVRYETLPDTILRNWIGGRGLGVYLALREIPPKADPLGPANKAIVMTGPLTGVTGVPAGGRWASITKSPLTYTIHDSQSGGKFGPYLKYAGLDGIIIEGVSEKPVYLYVHDGKVEVRDASHLWGKDVFDTTDTLIEEVAEEVGKSEKPKIKVACIGPAGENLVRIAAIMNDYNRAAGRGGHGAVWGSKKLKAIVVYGAYTKPKVADEEAFRKAVVNAMKKIKASAVTSQSLPKYGTAVLVNIINKAGIFPTRNFRTGVFPEAEKISGETMAEKYMDWKKQKEEICWGCPMGCARYTRVAGRFSGEGGGPEYETIWALGADTGTSDFSAIAKANYLCNELGLDTISMGATIAAFLELVEKGKIPAEKLRGLKAEWGNPEVIVELTWRTAYRSGIGNDLAEGAYRLAEKYGAPEVAMTVRRQELPAYDPRGAQGHGLGYATSNRGGCHLRAYMISPEVLGVPKLVDRFETKGKGKLVKEFQDVFAVVDSLVVCKFTTFALWTEDYVALLNAVTGFDYSEKELARVGERIYNAERAFNVLSFGDGKDYDTLPKRLLEEPMPEGPAKGYVVKLGEMLPEYYKARGWVDGRPTRKKLEELGLRWLADWLEEEGLLPG